MTKWKGSTVLMELGEWVLIIPVSNKEIQSYPIHIPCESGCTGTDRPGHHIPRCYLCSERVPDEIEALYVLHNWEVRSK